MRLRARNETVGAVVNVDRSGDEARYGVFHDGAINQYFASQLEQADDATPASRLVSAAELHARLTATLLLDENSDYLHTRNAGRIDFEPYQYRPVLKLVQAERPRILVADDVGVGKTIEACLVLKELQARQRADSVLVICPKPLVVDDKWRTELKRFDEDFVHLDSKALRWCLEELDREGEWPTRYRKAILPYSLLDEVLLTGEAKGRTKRIGLNDLVGDVRIDLLIVDEAHHVRNTATKAYQCVQRFADASDAVVMLSATPIQLSSMDLFTLVNLLRADLVMEPGDFKLMLEPNEFLFSAAQAARTGSAGWPTKVGAALAGALETSWGRDVMAPDPRVEDLRDLLQSGDEGDHTRVRAIRLVESLNTFSDIVTRTRRRDIGTFTTRKPSAPEVTFTDTQQQAYDAVIRLGARIEQAKNPGIPLKFLLSTLLRQAASSITGLAPLIEDLFENRLRSSEMVAEEEGEVSLTAEQVEGFRADMRHIQALASHLIGAEDPKVNLLRQIVEGKSRDAVDDEMGNKVLVFSTFRHTLAYLDERCRGWGVRVGVMHGGVPDEQRKDIRRRFKLARSHPDAVDVLLCSEIGTEGLDYQFCNTLVNYDIPWNPMRIEQRIGRIDRRGQESDTVAIINLLTRGTIEAEIYHRCLSRIGVFHHALGGSEKVLGDLAEAVVDIATNLAMTHDEQTSALRQLADNGIARVEEEQRLEEQQADLLGYAGRQFAESVADASSSWLEDSKIAALVRRYFEKLQPGRTIALRPGRIATVPLNPEAAGAILADLDRFKIDAVRLKRQLRRDRVILSMTTDPELVDESEDFELLGPTHPLVKLAAASVDRDGVPLASLRVTSDLVAPGTYPVGVYSWTALGVRDAMTIRFVSPELVIEENAAALLAEATEGESGSSIADGTEVVRRHSLLWSLARDARQRRHEDSVDRRVAALAAQKQRRLADLQRKIDATTDGQIAAMYFGEQRSSNAAFDTLMAAQSDSRGRADLKATHLANVVLEVVAT